MPDLEQLQKTVEQLEATLAQVKQAIVEANAAPVENFEQLKELLLTDGWPVAANKNLICDPENAADKVERGRGVVELMVETDLAGKKFLDYGCGEGHCAAYAASRNPLIAVGYDVKAKGWDQHSGLDKLVMTTNWDEVVKRGPFDAILSYDVIDHLESMSPVDALKQLHNVLADDGRIYLRTHPFTSRHALHNYHDLNKGYIQLAFSEEELKALLPDAKYIEWNTGKVATPLASYKTFFDEANLEILNTRPVKDVVEPFFKAPALANRIMKAINFKQFPEFQMGMQFIDYVLKKLDKPLLVAQ